MKIDYFEKYPELASFRDYFNAYKSRNRYYVAIKMGALSYMRRNYKDLTNTAIVSIIGTNHTALNYLDNKYVPHPSAEKMYSGWIKYVNSNLYVRPLKRCSDKYETFNIEDL
jgi:hypothetical protein